MGYHESLQKAADWIQNHQNPDGGWGLAPKQASSLVNTAEAIIILRRLSFYSREIEGGINFIVNNLGRHITTNGPWIRYVAFSLMAINSDASLDLIDFKKEWVIWLANSQNDDGGWGHAQRDNDSQIYPTCLALLCIQNSKLSEFRKNVEAGTKFLLEKRSVEGWSFEGPNKPATPTATALATLACIEIVGDSNGIFKSAYRKILEISHWLTEAEHQPGTAWLHCSYQWIIPAMLRLGEAPYSVKVADFVRTVNHQQFDGGWTEPGGSKTIRGQFWAFSALAAIQDNFDPAVHPYRIDSERNQDALTEPTFVHLKVRSKLAIILPAKIYRTAAYCILIIAVLTSLGGHRSISLLPASADFLIAWVIAFPFWKLVKSRESLFPVWIIKVGAMIIAGAQIINFMFGNSIFDISKFIKSWITSI